jgi:hypothetical protein
MSGLLLDATEHLERVMKSKKPKCQKVAAKKGTVASVIQNEEIPWIVHAQIRFHLICTAKPTRVFQGKGYDSYHLLYV